MKKNATYCSIISLIVTLLLGIYISYGYYSPPQIKDVYTMQKNGGDTLNIAYIGDSWAFLHSFHNCIIAKQLEDSLHRHVSVYSHGINGHTSKEIYEDLYKSTELKIFITERKFDYCFISVGINDTYKKMSTNYYKKSMEGILNLLTGNGIRPIILEIPDYNIKDAFRRQTISKKALRHLSMFVNNTPLDCKQQFRKALKRLVERHDDRDDISIIEYKSWNNNYSYDLKTLYRADGMHLNDSGYVRLDRAIIDVILLDIKQSYYKLK